MFVLVRTYRDSPLVNVLSVHIIRSRSIATFVVPEVKVKQVRILFILFYLLTSKKRLMAGTFERNSKNSSIDHGLYMRTKMVPHV